MPGLSAIGIPRLELLIYPEGLCTSTKKKPEIMFSNKKILFF